MAETRATRLFWLKGRVGPLRSIATFGRVGRAATPTLPLVQPQHRDTGDSFTPTLEHAAQFFETLLGERPAGTA